MLDYLWDLLHAHRKALLAALSVLLIQFVDSETADWIVAALGTVLVGATPNDEAAKRRVYKRR